MGRIWDPEIEMGPQQAPKTKPKTILSLVLVGVPFRTLKSRGFESFWWSPCGRDRVGVH